MAWIEGDRVSLLIIIIKTSQVSCTIQYSQKKSTPTTDPKWAGSCSGLCEKANTYIHHICIYICIYMYACKKIRIYIIYAYTHVYTCMHVNMFLRNVSKKALTRTESSSSSTGTGQVGQHIRRVNVVRVTVDFRVTL